MSASKVFKSRGAIALLAALWVAVLLAVRIVGWERAPALFALLLAALGIVTAVAFLRLWGATQDAVVARDYERARLAEEAEKIVADEGKADDARDPSDKQE